MLAIVPQETLVIRTELIGERIVADRRRPNSVGQKEHSAAADRFSGC
jgi:hypothetical protein